MSSNITNKNVNLFSSKCFVFHSSCGKWLFSHDAEGDFFIQVPDLYEEVTVEVEVCSLCTGLLNGSLENVV